MFSKFALVAVLLAFIAPTTSAASDDEGVTASLDGLELVDKTRRGELYTDPNADWGIYTRILLTRPQWPFARTASATRIARSRSR
jgi:hypothetical protein